MTLPLSLAVILLVFLMGRVPAGCAEFHRSPREPSKGCLATGRQVSLSRLNHRLPRGQAHPEVMEGTAEFHDQIANALLPQPDPVFDDTTAFDTTVDMRNPQPTLVQRLVRHVLLQRELRAAWLVV